MGIKETSGASNTVQLNDIYSYLEKSKCDRSDLYQLTALP